MATSSRPVFDPVDTDFDPVANAQRDDVESPSLSNTNALARFEFEPGRSKEGTKVLMVEWEDDATTKGIDADWEISWEGKKTVFPARDQTKESGSEAAVNRLYFLLGPGVNIPTAVALKKAHVEWKTNPLPAIFAQELGVQATEAGKKGVLHTIWAKRRLQALQQEIDKESAENVEGVGLQIVMAEKEWIEQNFGVGSKYASTSAPAFAHNASLNSPTSPRSPGGSRLMDKLKGLKLGTSSHDLNQDPAAPTSHAQNPLSPEGSDVAVGGGFGSFALLKGAAPTSSLAAIPPQATAQAQQQRRMIPQMPPSAVLQEQQQRSQAAGIGSLNAAFAPSSTAAAAASTGLHTDDADGDDDLFALPISPRSPEMTKSPFSFGTQDTMRYLRGEKA